MRYQALAMGLSSLTGLASPNAAQAPQIGIEVIQGVSEVAQISPYQPWASSAMATGPLSSAAGEYVSSQWGGPAQGGSTFAWIRPTPLGCRVTLSAFASGVNVESRSRVEALFEVVSPQPVAGVLDLSGILSQGTGETSSRYSLDVNLDGFIDLQAQGGVIANEIPFVCGPRPLRFRLIVEVEVDSRFTLDPMSADIDITFRTSGQLPFQAIGLPCGADLSGWSTETVQGRRYEFEIQGLNSTPNAFFVIGFSPRNIIAPPTLCPLLTDLSITFLRPIFLGSNTSGLAFEIPLSPGSFYLQHVRAEIGSDNIVRWYTSNAARVSVQ